MEVLWKKTEIFKNLSLTCHLNLHVKHLPQVFQLCSSQSIWMFPIPILPCFVLFYYYYYHYFDVVYLCKLLFKNAVQVEWRWRSRSRDGAVVRALASHQCDVGLIPSRRRSCPFRKRSMPFSATLRKFFNYQQIFLYLIKEKGKYASNHPVSNPEPLFPNISLIPLHYQVQPPNFRKI